MAEYDKLREHATELWLRSLLCVAYVFGIRKSELLDMRVRQVDLAEGTIALETGRTKNDRPQMIAMTAEVKTLLSVCVHQKQVNDHVFTRDGGERIKDFRGTWEKLFRDAGLPPRHFHDLRRSAVRNMIRAGVDRDTAMRISGHLTPSVFSRYNIQAADDLRDAAELIEARAARLRAIAQETATKTETPPDDTRTHESAVQ